VRATLMSHNALPYAACVDAYLSSRVAPGRDSPLNTNSRPPISHRDDRDRAIAAVITVPRSVLPMHLPDCRSYQKTSAFQDEEKRK